MTNGAVSEEADNIKSYLEIQELFREKGIKISTMTITCSVGVCVDTRLYYKYSKLSKDNLVQISAMHQDEPVLRTAITRTILSEDGKLPGADPKSKAHKRPKRAFDNQVTFLMKIDKEGSNFKNAKLFNNGSVQMTGCRDIEEVKEVVTKLIRILKAGRVVNFRGEKYLVDYIRPIDPSADKLVPCQKSDQIRPIGMKLPGRKIRDRMNMHNCCVHMINSNFKVDFLIDRPELERILRTHYRYVPFVPKSKEHPYASAATTHQEHYRLNVINDPSGTHACVNIGYPYDDDNKPHIFVFYTGSINITGATALPHILEAHRFITEILHRHRNRVELPKISTARMRQAIRNVFRKAREQGIVH